MAEGNLAFTITKANPQALAELGTNPQAGGELVKALQHILNMVRESDKGDAKAAPAPQTPFAVFAFEAKEPLLLPGALTSDPAGVRTALYHAQRTRTLYLTVSGSEKHVPAFNRTCHLLSEYARSLPGSLATEDYCREHYRTVFSRNALKHLSAGEPIFPAK